MPTILILGATSDIGQAIAREFAHQKYHIQLAARNTTTLNRLQTDLEIRNNVLCSVHHFDAVDFDSHLPLYQSLHPKPDIVACVFGYMKNNDITIHSSDETLNTIQTNFTGAVSILNIVATDFSLQKKGTIIGISSVAGERGRQSNYIYGSAKAGFTAYLSGLRNKLYNNGVHVITVLPGFVYTKMTAHLTLPKALTAKPKDVAKSVYRAVRKKKNVIYVKGVWRWIMLIIKLIPEAVFKRLKL